MEIENSMCRKEMQSFGNCRSGMTVLQKHRAVVHPQNGGNVIRKELSHVYGGAKVSFHSRRCKGFGYA